MPVFWMLVGLGVAYLLGSVPTGYWIARAAKGIDIRQFGSGNIGSSNVGRVLGRPWGITVLILDILKGTLAVILGQKIFFDVAGPFSLDAYKILCAAMAVCGHNWTVFLWFRGGKGVATSAGALLGLSPLLLLLTAAIWGIVARISGYISVASMAAGIGFCALTFVVRTSLEMKIFGLVMTAMLIFRHRENLRRLAQGREPKMGQGDPGKISDAVR